MKMFTNNVSLRYFETQPKTMVKQLQWHDTLAFMDVGLIHKPRYCGVGHLKTKGGI
jgi:hypothetical protein